MEFTDVVWGLVVIAAGIFVAVYGTLLFKFALAAMGFGIGFIGAWWLLDSQSDATRLLIAIAVGGIGAAVLFALARFGLYIAGAILGLVLSLLIGGIIEILGPSPNNTVMVILAIAGLAGGGFIGPRLGQLVVLLATSGAGAYLIVDGIQIWYASRIGGDLDDPSQTLGQRLTLTIFLVLFAMSALSQYNARDLRRRVLN